MKVQLWKSRAYLKHIPIDFSSRESVLDSLIDIADAVDKLSSFKTFDTRVLRVEPIDDLEAHVAEVLDLLFDFADEHLIHIT